MTPTSGYLSGSQTTTKLRRYPEKEKHNMSKQGSIAPKERINIVYKSTGDGKEEVELPHKTLVLDNFLGRVDDRPLAEREPINVDKNNFKAVMAEQKLSLDLAVPNKLSEEEDAGDLAVSLKFENLADFTPDGLVQQVPELKKLMELRDALTALKSPLGNVAAFRTTLREMMNDESSRNRLLAEISAVEQGDKPNED